MGREYCERKREKEREGEKARVRGARERVWGDRVWKKHDRMSQ